MELVLDVGERDLEEQQEGVVPVREQGERIEERCISAGPLSLRVSCKRGGICEFK